MKLLDESVILGLLNNLAARLAFPFLTVPKVKPGCCGHASTRVQPNYNAIKQAISALAPDELKQLLAFAKLSSARMIYTQDDKIVDVKLG